jgi:hypothetical protein
LAPGYNEIALRSRSGSFDPLSLNVPTGIKLASPTPTVIRAVAGAPYAVSLQKKTPATVRVEVYRKDTAGKLEVPLILIVARSQMKAREVENLG